MHIAAYYENTDGVQTLLGAGADIQALSEDGSTPLHDAGVENGTGGSVTLLLVAGANIEARTRDRATPLHRAAAYGTPEAIAALLEAGADGKAKNKDGRTPFDLAKDNEQLKGTEAYGLLKAAQYLPALPLALYSCGGVSFLDFFFRAFGLGREACCTKNITSNTPKA